MTERSLIPRLPRRGRPRVRVAKAKRLMKRLLRALPLLVLGLVSLTLTRTASALPAAHILRIDPRAGVTGGAPILTMVVEVVQFNSFSHALEPCAGVTSASGALDCESDALEKKGAIWSPIEFYKDKARLLVKVDGADTYASVSGDVARWGDSQKQPGIGTAWLVTLDASSGMGPRYGEARAVAREFIEAMQPNDLMNLMIFDDKQVVRESKWSTYAQRNNLVKVLNDQASTMPSHGRDRPLFSELQTMTRDGFNSLGNTSGPQNIPLHQAMVVLSNGSGRNDVSSAAPAAGAFHEFVTKGRFPDDNTSLPKTPLPLISIWFPVGSGLVNDVMRNNDEQFMQTLANPEIGGFFDIVRENQGEAKGKKIIQLVKSRFNAMYIVHWRLGCLNSTVQQSFDLEFLNTQPVIAGDSSFKDVPIGVDPSQWPLDIDVKRTQEEANNNPLYPGGTFKVFGDFCWGGEKSRAEAYFIPAGTKPDPGANSTDPELAKRVVAHLIEQNMRGAAKDASDTFAVFEVPDDDKILEGSGDTAVARLVVYDNKAHRASGHDEKSVLTLKAKSRPFNLLLIVGAVGFVVVVGLLVIVVMRGGGGSKTKRGQPPPAPIIAGGGPGGGGAPPGYGSPPAGGGYAPPGQGGYGGPPPGGYGASPQGPGAPAAPGPQAYGGAPPQPDAAAAGQGYPPPGPGGPPAVVQVRCPACQMMTMATPGQPSVCFACGQPLPASVTGAGSGAPPLFP